MNLPAAQRSWNLRLHPEQLAFAKLPPGSEVPDWARAARHPITTVSWSQNETSVLAPVAAVPSDVDRFGPWQAFEVEGHIDFLLTGVLSGIIAPLASSQIAVTTLSTYQTDWILVPAEQAEQAVNVWRYHGHVVTVLPASDAAPSQEEQG
ncbi:ACT domain-containing protein [Gephyromycinifex aptenodytis]|uniref:ACT domain-containing protein n=1 Tax=Gephyromycinifex aptenodytis TaxID=2716227 RepID=UPI00144805AC|nr:ACT domain-containing protein [Gephyromycinifex aptenodytis]